MFKICFVNIPIRSCANVFPPLGVTRLIDSLSDAGYKYQEQTFFYNLDLIRPTDEEAAAYFKKLQPDIVGISAVVSTSYAYVKRISRVIREALPGAAQLIGGNMAAAAEVLLKKCEIDVCVVGEGEDTIRELCAHWERHGHLKDNSELRRLQGIAFESVSDDHVFFTGYRQQIENNRIRQPNYKILDDYYMQYLRPGYGYESDPRILELSKKYKRSAGLELSKGCVSRCTFCHRWNKGYRVLDMDQVIADMKRLMEEQNVGFFDFYDENFGADKRYILDFLKRVKPLGVLWHVSGMRVKSVGDVSLLNEMRDAGCVSVKFGMESGSDRMLTIMEKLSTKAEDNYRALEALKESGLLGMTTIQLVIGMPGENTETLKATLKFVKRCKKLAGRVNVASALAQALPGTPLYEFGRIHGYIGSGIDEEEEYLIRISDQDKGEIFHFINMSEESISEILYWHYIFRSMHFGFYQGLRGRVKRVLTWLLKTGLTPWGFKFFVKFLITYRYCLKDLKRTLRVLSGQEDKKIKISEQSLRKTVYEMQPEDERAAASLSVNLLRESR